MLSHMIPNINCQFCYIILDRYRWLTEWMQVIWGDESTVRDNLWIGWLKDMKQQCLWLSFNNQWHLFYYQDMCFVLLIHDDVTKRKHFPRCWPFVWGIHRSPVNSPHKGQWCRALMFSLICARINHWVNNREAGDLKRHHIHNDVNVMSFAPSTTSAVFEQGHHIISSVSKIRSNIYRSDIQVTFDLCGYFRYLQVLYLK